MAPKPSLSFLLDKIENQSLLSIEKYTKRLDDDIKEQGREAVRRRVQQIKYNLLNL